MRKKISDSVYWVGFVDWNVRDFHGYVTPRGSTYNAYLVRDQKTALIDTVKEPYSPELLASIARYLPPSRLDYVVINHAEPDHAGSLSKVMRQTPQAVVVTNAKCKSHLESYHPDAVNWTFEVVKDGDTLSLGNRTLRFFTTPMLHWPDSMFTWVEEEKILFSMDAFGQHYATSQRFDDEARAADVFLEAKTYYANIILPYGAQTLKQLDRASGLDIRIIAPSHGVLWRSHIRDITNAYRLWATHTPVAKVLIIYDSMWHSTELMAEAIYDGADRDGVEVKLFDVKATDITTLATETLDAAALAIGTPTLNDGMMPKMAEFLTYIRGLKPRNKSYCCFGSYGWGKKGGPGEIHEVLAGMGWESLRDPLQSQFRPTEKILAECEQLGTELAGKALVAARQP